MEWLNGDWFMDHDWSDQSGYDVTHFGIIRKKRSNSHLSLEQRYLFPTVNKEAPVVIILWAMHLESRW